MIHPGKVALALPILIGTALAPAARGQASPPGDPAATIRAEAKAAKDAYFALLEKEPPEAEAKAAGKAYGAKLQGLMERALATARAEPGTPAATGSLTWVLSEMPFTHDAKRVALGDAAYDLLAAAPVLEGRTVESALFNGGRYSVRTAHAEPFIRAVLAKARDRRTAALARYALAEHQQKLAEAARQLASPTLGPDRIKECSPAHLARLRAVDGDRLRAEAAALYEQVVREDADVVIRDSLPTLGALAAGGLFKLRNLAVGQPAPELIGEDLDGRPIRLSDFRGKVVVLSFWATWCGPCMELVPEEKALVAALAGRPFVLVGVNGDRDEDRDQVRRTIAAEGITWRSFRSGRADGSIAERWAIDAWPTVYTIDARGIIREDDFDGSLTPAMFEALVAEAEADAQGPAPAAPR